MKITVAGAGHGGSTIAADLTLKGHEVTLLKTSSSQLHSEHFVKLLNDKSLIFRDINMQDKLVHLFDVTTSFQSAISSAELIIVYLQTNYHKSFIDNIKPYLRKGQIILFEPGYLSTSYLLDEVEAKQITIVEAESSPIDCRIISPGVVEVLFRNVRNPIAIYPRRNTEFVKSFLDMLDYSFVVKKSVIEVALHNPNLIVHTVGAIMSIPRIEYTQGEYWMYKEVFTPSVWNIVEKLDREKMNVLVKLGFDAIKYLDACRERNSLDITVDSEKVFFNYAQNSSPKGPNKVNARYITEDVPEGLVLLESLGKHLSVDTTTCTALIDIASAALGIDFRINGRTLEKIGIENLDIIINDNKGK